MTQLVSSNTYYRCVVSCGTFSANSVSKLVTLGGIPIGGTAIASSTTSCAGNTISFSLVGNSSWSGTNFQWQSSVNNVNWTNISGALGANTSQVVNSSTYYRCVLACGSNSVASTSVYIASAVPVTYANLPYYETFDNIWQNGCATRNVPNNMYWRSSPLTGDNAWRQQNDGISANWTSPLAANVTPYSGAGCANFHSTQALANAKGDLDVLVNFSQNAKYAISFYYINSNGSDFLNVLLSTDAGISFSIKGYYPVQSTWAKKTIYYDAVNTPSCVVKFKGNADNGVSDLGIDSLSIRMVCLNPSISAVTTSDTLCVGQTATLTAQGAANYTWSPIGSSSTSVVVSPTTSTNYVLTGSNDGICFPTTNVSILVLPCAIGIEELIDGQLSVYPNPIKSQLNIDVNEDKLTFSLEITNSLGEIVLKRELFEKHSVISVEELLSGVYFYKLQSKNTTLRVGKLIKQ